MEEFEHILMCCDIEISIIQGAITKLDRVVLVHDASDLDHHTFDQLDVLIVISDHFDFLA